MSQFFLVVSSIFEAWHTIFVDFSLVSPIFRPKIPHFSRSAPRVPGVNAVLGGSRTARHSAGAQLGHTAGDRRLGAPFGQSPGSSGVGGSWGDGGQKLERLGVGGWMILLGKWSISPTTMGYHGYLRGYDENISWVYDQEHLLSRLFLRILGNLGMEVSWVDRWSSCIPIDYYCWFFSIRSSKKLPRVDDSPSWAWPMPLEKHRFSKNRSWKCPEVRLRCDLQRSAGCTLSIWRWPWGSQWVRIFHMQWANDFTVLRMS